MRVEPVRLEVRVVAPEEMQRPTEAPPVEVPAQTLGRAPGAAPRPYNAMGEIPTGYNALNAAARERMDFELGTQAVPLADTRGRLAYLFHVPPAGWWSAPSAAATTSSPSRGGRPTACGFPPGASRGRLMHSRSRLALYTEPRAPGKTTRLFSIS